MKLVSLISGGIDSPVATYLMMKKEVEVIALHLDNRPFADEKQLDKSLKLVKHLENLFDKSIKTFVVPHGDNQVAFARNCRRNLQCVLCKRMMLRIAAKMVEKEGADGILTGESLGQVASQTLQNIHATNQAVKTPIMRPLIGMDKVEIIDIARRIGTYDLSILPGLCCTIVPKKPSTAAKLDIVLREEEKVKMDSLVEKSMEGASIISC